MKLIKYEFNKYGIIVYIEKKLCFTQKFLKSNDSKISNEVYTLLYVSLSLKKIGIIVTK